MTHCQPDKKIIEIDPMTEKRRQYSREKLSRGPPRNKEEKKKKTNSIGVQGECSPSFSFESFNSSITRYSLMIDIYCVHQLDYVVAYLLTSSEILHLLWNL